MRDFVEACRKFIELDSTPAVGNADIAEFAAELCREAGLNVELQTEMLNGVRQTNVIARPSATRPTEEFLLQTHLDTCDPGAYGLWTRTGANPYSASIYQESSDIIFHERITFHIKEDINKIDIQGTDNVLKIMNGIEAYNILQEISIDNMKKFKSIIIECVELSIPLMKKINWLY